MKKTLLQQLTALVESWKGSAGDVPVQEKSNLAEWLESRLHMMLTNIADDMFGNGNVTRDERKILSGAIGAALDTYHQYLVDNAPQLFQRRPWEDAPEGGAGASVAEGVGSGKEQERSRNDIDLAEAGDGMFIPLIEKAIRRDGTIPIKIIKPGWGSSGYYPAEVLERDGPKIFRTGVKMFWNHQTATEEAERPEGDLNNLAAELVTDARYQANGPAGAGLYADAKVFEGYKTPIDDLASHIGVSIRAFGKAQHGVMEGREGAIITELSKARSVDFVTAPGAGGQILSLFEAARTKPAVQNNTTTTESVDPKIVHKEARVMDEKQFKDLQESVATLQNNLGAVTGENARLKEAMALRDAKELVSAALTKFALPEATKARLLESLPMTAPMKDGALDKAAFETKIAEAVKGEIAYLTSTLGLGTIKGLGESYDGDGDDKEVKVDEALKNAFEDLGLSQAAVETAVRGRK